MIWTASILEDLLSLKPVPEACLEVPILRNIAKTIECLVSGKRQQTVDLTFTVKQALAILRYQAPPSQEAILKVPKNAHFPTRAEWENADLSIYKEDSSNFFLHVNKWQPGWLSTGAVSPVLDAYKEVNRRCTRRVAPDPYLLRFTPHKEFTSTAQRDAIRAILSMPEGATLGIAIPTGAGKSLCAWLPPFISHGLAVVIVPTVALALDQEKSVNALFDYPTAYQGGPAADLKEKRKQIRENIKNGRQQIVFTSPENVLGSLFLTLKSAAASNKLTHFVIDEAHMVYEWGNDFRSSFQSMAGIWKALLHSSEGRLKTIFLSATYTGESKRVLETLFKGPKGFAFWSSLKLREEPSYWIKKCLGETERETYLLEAIRNAPRPMIIYTTRVEDAKRLYNRVQKLGYSRVGILTGDSSTSERVDLIAQWREEEVDIVVGTSAFGLGIDKGNVRTVIHACVPENVDRYYQEVGRGGRDGKACISLVLYTQEDIETAKSLNSQQILTTENGWRRWRKMFSSGQKSPSLIEVDLRCRPDIDLEPGDYNENWNLRTLLLMVQANMISFSSMSKANSEQVASDLNLSDSKKNVTVEILDIHHFSEIHWKTRIEEVRVAIKAQNRKGYQAMIEVLEGRDCVGKILRKFYESQVGRVSPACGGCLVCRKNGLPPRPGLLPTKNLIWPHYDPTVTGDLKKITDRVEKVFVEFEVASPRRDEPKELILKLAKWFAERGIINFVVDKAYRSLLTNALSPIAGVTFIYTFEDYFDLPPLPTMFLDFGSNAEAIGRQLVINNNVVTISLFPYGTRDPNNEHRFLTDMIGAPAKLYKLKELTQNLGIV